MKPPVDGFKLENRPNDERSGGQEKQGDIE